MFLHVDGMIAADRQRWVQVTLASLIHEGAFAGYPAPAVPLAA